MTVHKKKILHLILGTVTWTSSHLTSQPQQACEIAGVGSHESMRKQLIQFSVKLWRKGVISQKVQGSTKNISWNKQTQRGEMTKTKGSGYSSLTAKEYKEHRKESTRRIVLWTNV